VAGSCLCVNLNTHFHLVPKLIMHGVNLHSPLHITSTKVEYTEKQYYH
jgi:hypothetical protein